MQALPIDEAIRAYGRVIHNAGAGVLPYLAANNSRARGKPWEFPGFFAYDFLAADIPVEPILVSQGAGAHPSPCMATYPKILVDLKEGAVDSGSGARFDQFLREQREALIGFLRSRTRSEEDAYDAAQESLARLMRYQASHPAEAWEPLLYRIAINVANDQSRSAQRRHASGHVPIDEAVRELPSNAPALDEQLIRQQELARLGEIIQALPPRCREVYLLSRVQGMKNVEIAKHCAISVKAVEKHMSKAMAAVREGLGKSGSGAL